MQFNYAHTTQNVIKDPEYQKPYGDSLPRLKAPNNMTYLQFVDMVQYLWSRAHPEIEFRPFADNHNFNPEKGYLIYGLVNREPQSNNAKPRQQEVVDHPDYPDKRLIIFSWSFINTIKFTALHQNPRTAEEIIEAFEDFIIEATPIFIELGVQSMLYGRRAADEHKTRYGEDLAARSIIYSVVTQKIIMSEVDKLEEILIEAQIHCGEPQSATPNSGDVLAYLLDHHATPCL